MFSAQGLGSRLMHLPTSCQVAMVSFNDAEVPELLCSETLSVCVVRVSFVGHPKPETRNP